MWTHYFRNSWYNFQHVVHGRRLISVLILSYMGLTLHMHHQQCQWQVSVLSCIYPCRSQSTVIQSLSVHLQWWKVSQFPLAASSCCRLQASEHMIWINSLSQLLLRPTQPFLRLFHSRSSDYIEHLQWLLLPNANENVYSFWKDGLKSSLYIFELQLPHRQSSIVFPDSSPCPRFSLWNSLYFQGNAA